MIHEENAISNNEHQCKNTELFPQYWNILSDSDKNGYISLRNEINVLNTKRIFRDRTGTFTKILQLIQKYAERKDEDDWKRFLVCGICWVDNGIAVNIRQLKILISKCKSSINGSLQKLGYLPSQLHVNTKLILFPLIPFLSKNYNELRQWTIRFFQKYNTVDKNSSLNPNINQTSLNNKTENAKLGPITDFIQPPKPIERIEMHPIPLINFDIHRSNETNILNNQNENTPKVKKKVLMPILADKGEPTIEKKINIENNNENNEMIKKNEIPTPFIITPPKFRTIASPNFQNIK